MRKSVFFFLFCLYNGAFAQEYSPYFNLPQHNNYINYLVNSGKLKMSHPLSQPFVSNELADSLPVPGSSFDKHWLGLLNKDLGKFSTLEDTLNQYGRDHRFF